MRIRLRLNADAIGEELIDLEWHDGALREHFVAPDMRSTVDRWRDGLGEWVGDEAEYRETPTSDPLFLPRLADYLKRQFELQVILETDEAA